MLTWRRKLVGESRFEKMGIMFSLFSMTHLGNTKNIILSRCRLRVNMTNDVKLLYYQGNTNLQTM